MVRVTLAERLLRLVEKEPGIAQAEAARRLGVRYPHLRQVVLGLLRRGELERVQDGVYRLYPRGMGAAARVSETTISPASEDEVKERLEGYLRRQGWKVEVRYGKRHGPDLVAYKEGVRWIIEAKGPGRYPPMRVNYFLNVLGEILLRMGDRADRYSVAFPDLPQFRNLWRRLPREVKQRLSLTAFFVGKEVEEA